MNEGGIATAIRAMSPPRYTVSEAAKAVGRSEDTLVRWRKNGTYMPSERRVFGSIGVWLYTEQDIVRMKQIKKSIKPGRKSRAA